MARRTHAENQPIFVKVAEVGGTVQEVCLNGERTIADALKAAGFAAETPNVKVNGESMDGDVELEDGDILTIGKKTGYGAL